LGRRWCTDCQQRVPRINKPFCDKCGIPTNGADICKKCQSNPPAYRMMRSWAVFDSPVQNALHTMKYRSNIGLGDRLAIQMSDFLYSLQWHVQAILPVPLGKKRLKERGYNQVALVARPLAYEVGLEYIPQALQKTRETRSQVGLGIAQRHENVHDAYRADSQGVKGRSILLMDDVATTGSTISACTESLLSAGAQDVYVLTIARALSHHGLSRV
jgi:ComF family protein